MNITSDKLYEAVKDDLENYTDEVIKNVKETIKEVASETKKIIDDKAKTSFKDRTGKYRKSLKIKKTYESDSSVSYVWHASGKEYRLTHLLEKGHAIKRGGRTVGSARAFPHIKYGDRYVKENLPNKIKKAIEDAR